MYGNIEKGVCVSRFFFFHFFIKYTIMYVQGCNNEFTHNITNCPKSYGFESELRRDCIGAEKKVLFGTRHITKNVMRAGRVVFFSSSCKHFFCFFFFKLFDFWTGRTTRNTHILIRSVFSSVLQSCCCFLALKKINLHTLLGEIWKTSKNI